MKRYKALNEREFHRMISEATMRVVTRVLQEAAGFSEDYGEKEPYYGNDEDYVGQPDAENHDYDYPDDYEDYDYPRY